MLADSDYQYFASGCNCGRGNVEQITEHPKWCRVWKGDINEN